MSRTDTPRRPRGHTPLRVFAGLDGWWLASAGIEAQRAISVGRAKLTVCYKVHVIPSHRTKYKASITVWPRSRRRFTSARQAGWHPDLVKKQLVSGVCAGVASTWLPRDVAMESLGSLRRLLEVTQRFWVSGERGTQA